MTERIRELLEAGNLNDLFVRGLGWDHPQDGTLRASANDNVYHFEAVAQKRGFTVFQCHAVPDHATRVQLDRQVAKRSARHLVVFADPDTGMQEWQWTRPRPGRPPRLVCHTYRPGHTNEPLIQRLAKVRFTFEEEADTTILDVVDKMGAAFDAEKVTKRFYEHFKYERERLAESVQNIDHAEERAWYASVLLSRLMFLYFIQQKGFLDGDRNYLATRLAMVRDHSGDHHFYSFYRAFLLPLFHGALGAESAADEAAQHLIGDVPYINGSIFGIHELEQRYHNIQIPDDAFNRIFQFFDQYRWHLDETPLRDDSEINPDVLGYIFERYVNQKEMGAYYTKEDVTGYIAANTILPSFMSKVDHFVGNAFDPWRVATENPDRYIKEPMLHGVDLPLPDEISSVQAADGSDEYWTSVAPSAFALPTETWGEVIHRRQRVEALRHALAYGEINSVDEAISFNLNLRALVTDSVRELSDESVILGVFQALREIKVLDPTCGSGAFLFAALEILADLYDACLLAAEARQREPGHSSPEESKCLAAALDEIDNHPSREYGILRSVLLCNLFGVDIMPEAVEIAKLRLYLKLVAEVETRDQIEPLPDIDFNIKSGNSLLGFASEEHLEAVLCGRDQKRLDVDGYTDVLAEQLHRVARATRDFREDQLSVGSSQLEAGTKEWIEFELDALRSFLNEALATDGSLGGSTGAGGHSNGSQGAFHWLVEFYEAITSGGFDAVIGNPPYVEYRNVSGYWLRNYRTLPCGDLFAFTVERASDLCSASGHIGLIVPMSAFSVSKMKPLQDLLYGSSIRVHVSSWSGDAHPARLFEGVNKRLQIILAEKWDGSTSSEASGAGIRTTRYIKWYASERSHLFDTAPVYFAQDASASRFFQGSLPKLESSRAQNIMKKLQGVRSTVESRSQPQGTVRLYYTRKVSFFLQFLDFIPEKRDDSGASQRPSELKEIRYADSVTRDICLAALSSSLFYWHFITNSDCRNLNKREVATFPVPDLEPADRDRISSLVRKLMSEYKSNSELRTVEYRGVGNVTVQYFNFRPSKPTLDEIDRLLGPYYGLTSNEIEYVIRYDLKFRLGMVGEHT